MPEIPSVYRLEKPQESPYYQCIEDHFDRFELVYDDDFAKQHGFCGFMLTRNTPRGSPPDFRNPLISLSVLIHVVLSKFSHIKTMEAEEKHPQHHELTFSLTPKAEFR